ncbi:hypothetical protein MRB53_018873 [Persea americana]|uniref:Uncharacterized protein n=1 Tax=Persea americana TaxID=3435 RepID=A0ACC2MA28_PERAE|nr:hypothetical protein MRB53_018873 [Persea americana]
MAAIGTGRRSSFSDQVPAKMATGGNGFKSQKINRTDLVQIFSGKSENSKSFVLAPVSAWQQEQQCYSSSLATLRRQRPASSPVSATNTGHDNAPFFSSSVQLGIETLLLLHFR